MRKRGNRRKSSQSPEEELFQSELGEHISAGSARLLFGVWLAERGDWRADGYLWLAQRRKEPSRAYRTFDWWHVDSNCREEITLPGAMWELLPVPPHDGFPQAKEFPTRQAAEEAVCRLIADHRGRF